MTKEERRFRQLVLENSVERLKFKAERNKPVCISCGKPIEPNVYDKTCNVKPVSRDEFKRRQLERKNMTEEEKKELEMKKIMWENNKLRPLKRHTNLCSECQKKIAESCKVKPITRDEFKRRQFERKNMTEEEERELRMKAIMWENSNLRPRIFQTQLYRGCQKKKN